MILYNVTLSVDPPIAQQWLDWMREKHIPDVMSTNCFLESRISRIHGEEEGGVTFSVMYLCANQELLDLYQSTYASKLQKEHADKFEGKFVAFRTYLSVIQEYKQ